MEILKSFLQQTIIAVLIFLTLCYLQTYNYLNGLHECACFEESKNSTEVGHLEMKSHSLDNTSIFTAAPTDNRCLFDKDTPIIYVITPTYTRLVQKAELTRLSQTLMHVINLHWILVEDSPVKSDLVARLLENSGLCYEHLNVPKSTNGSHKGIDQRNMGLGWIYREEKEGVVYFADDDNTYDLKLFDTMRSVTRVGVWPVGLAGGAPYETPVVGAAGRVVAWVSGWEGGRVFPVDMAGYAVNIKFMTRDNMKPVFSKTRAGYLESTFLESFVRGQDLEPRADNCTKVLVWHTQTKPPIQRAEKDDSWPFEV